MRQFSPEEMKDLEKIYSPPAKAEELILPSFFYKEQRFGNSSEDVCKRK